MSRRIEIAARFFLLLTPMILEFSIVLAIMGIWNWTLAAVYAVSTAGLALTIFEKCGWRKQLVFFIVVEGCQFLLSAIPLGIRAMF